MTFHEHHVYRHNVYNYYILHQFTSHYLVYTSLFQGLQDLNDGAQLLMWGANDVGQCGLPAKRPIDIASPTEAEIHRETAEILRCF